MKTNKIFFFSILFKFDFIFKVYMDNIRNELLTGIQQLKNNQEELEKELDNVNKTKEVNKVMNINLMKNTWTFNRTLFLENNLK